MKLLTVSELAKKAKGGEGVNKSYIYKLINSGKLPYKKIGHLIVFNPNSREIIDFTEDY